MIGTVVGATVTFATFVAATAGGVLLHLDLPATRRLVATQVSSVLTGTFMGKVEIEDIAGLGLRGIEGVRVRVRDPEGVQVIHVDNIRVGLRPIDALKSVAFGGQRQPITIRIPSASIGNADVNVDTDPTNKQLRIANAFESKNPSKSPEKPNEPPGRSIRIEVDDVKLGHAWVHGTPPDAIALDAELAQLAGHAHVDVPGLIRAELDHVQLLTRGLPRSVDPRGSLRGRFVMPSPETGEGMNLDAIFDGQIGGMPTTAEAHMIDKLINARIDTIDPHGTHARQLATEVELRPDTALSLHAEARGELPFIDAKANIKLGKTTLDTITRVVVTPSVQIESEVSARHVDAAVISEGAPPTDLGLDAIAKFELHEGDIRGEAAVETLPGHVDGKPVPRVVAKAKATSSKSATASVRIYEELMPTEVNVQVSPRSDNVYGQIITAEVKSHADDLQRVPIVGKIAEGKAAIEASATLKMPEKAIDAKAKVAVRDFKPSADLAVTNTEVTADVNGTIDRPVIDAKVEATQIKASTLPFTKVNASARITPVGSNVTISDAKVAVKSPGAERPIDVSTRTVRIGPNTLKVEGVEVLGLGDPIRAEMSKDPRQIKGQIDAPNINLGVVSRILQREKDLDHGSLAIKGEGAWLTAHGGEAKGKVHLEARDVAVRQVKGANATIDAEIDNRELALDLNADLPRAARVTLNTDKPIRLGGRPDDPSSWRKAYGRVHLTSEADLAKVAALLPPDALPVAELRGVLSVQGRVARDAEDAPPEIMLHAHSLGLTAAARAAPPQKIDGVVIEQEAPWRSTDLDFGLDVRNDGTSGLTNVAFRVTDRRGPVVALDAKTILPFEEITENPSIARDRLIHAPMAVKIVVPPRRLDQLPAILAVRDMQGAAEATIDLEGTAVEPHVRVAARGRSMRSAAMPPDVRADADLALDYDGNAANLAMKVRSLDKELIDLAAHVEARVHDLLEPSAGGMEAFNWNASARARLGAFPLESIPQLTDRRVKGRISGEVQLDGLHRDAIVKGKLDLEDLRVGRAKYAKGAVTIDTSGGKLAAKVRLDQPPGKDAGFLEATAGAGLHWGAELVPQLDDKQPLEAKLVAKSFRAAAIQPFVEAQVPVLDGRVEANASAKLVPGKPGAELQGTVIFHDGTVQLAAVGEELRGVKAHVQLSPDGTIKVTDVAAKGTQGAVYADAEAKIDGMRLDHATANIRIPEKEALDLALEGQPVGDISGNIQIKASQSPDAKNTSIAVDIPRLKVELPKVTKSGLQTLEEKENVHVGVYRGRPESRRFFKLPLDKDDQEPPGKKDGTAPEATRLDVDVKLGRVEIEKGNQARIVLAGNPKVRIVGDKTELFGQIRAESGWADVQGKKFEIDKGTITFNGEPDNPVVVATARWRGPDGSDIFADFVGPVKTGKVTLRSEPPRPRNEILAIILFGTADGANPTPPPPGSQANGTTKAAVGLGGGFAAEGLTEALDDLAGIKATARIDSTRANNPRPEIEFQLSTKVSISFAHVIGTPPITEPDRNLASVEYRFHKNWSLETTVGDRGTALLDALWQKRY